MATLNKKPNAKKADVKAVETTVENEEGKVTSTDTEDTPETTNLTPDDGVNDVTVPEVSDENGDDTNDVSVSDEEGTILVDEPEEGASTDEVVMTPKEKSRPIERNVKVCLNTDHSCSIGGVRYHFEKGKSQNVPESVKAILKQAGLLTAL